MTEPNTPTNPLEAHALEENRPPCRSFSSADLLRLDPHRIDWLVAERLPQIGTSLLAGTLGTGKSTLARDLALSVARAEPWLDFACAQGRVLYVYLEGELETLRSSFAARGLRPDDPIDVLDSVQTPLLLRRIRERAKTLEPALIIVDGLRPLLHAEELNHEEPGSSALDRVLDLARDVGAHLMIVHDLETGRSTEMSSLLGSTQRSIDTLLLMNRAGERRELRTVQHRGKGLSEPVVVPSFRCRPGLANAGFAPSLPDEILAYLKKTQRLATQREILENVTEPRPQAVLRALNFLRRSGALIRVGRGLRGDPYLYTGFSRIPGPAGGPWLRRVRPWATLPRPGGLSAR